MDSILIVAHGNQSGDNSRTERQAEGLREIVGLPVFCAYRRFSEDRVKAVMKRMAEQGLRDVLVIPMFMSANMYSDSIPRAMGLRDAGSCGIFREDDRELRYRITTTLGDWKGSADLVAEMADAYGDAGVLLVCGCSDKGEPDPLVKRSMEIISSRGHNVEYCANTRDPEPGAEAIERMRLGGSERIAAIPVAMGATVRFPTEGVEISHSFGDDPGIPRILADIVEAYDDSNISVVISAHGSEVEMEKDAARDCASILSERLGMKVRYAYKGKREPTVPTVMSEIANEGKSRLIVLPLFFAPGMFADRIVPAKFGLPQGEHSGDVEVDGKRIHIEIGDAFGIHPSMRNIMEDAVKGNVTDDGKITVMLIGHGSPDGWNSNVLQMNAGYVRDMGHDVLTCYNGMENPSVEEGLDMALAGDCDRLLVIPMFVSPSNHSTVEIPEKLGLAPGERKGTLERDGRKVEVIYAEEIGLSPLMADLLCDEYLDMLPRMNAV